MEGDDDDYNWTEEDYKRVSAMSRVDFARFYAMRDFDRQRLENSLNFFGNSHLMSREEYALFVNKSITDVVVPETLKKKKMEGEGEGGEFESEKKKRKTDKRICNKNKLYDDLSPDDVFQYYAEEVVVSKYIDLEDPAVQAEIAEKRKLFEERCELLHKIYVEEGPASNEAKASNEAAQLLV